MGIKQHLDMRVAADELCTGSRELARRLADWIATGECAADRVRAAQAEEGADWRPPARRLGYLAAGVVLGGQLVLTAPVVLWPAGAAWCVAAWLVQPRSAETEQHDGDQDHDQDAEEQTPLPSPTEEEPAGPDPVTPAVVVQLCHQAAAGRHGAHLEDVLAAGRAAGLMGGWDKPALRSELERLGVEVVPQLKVAGKNRAGVRVGDLPDPGEGPASPTVTTRPEAATPAPPAPPPVCFVKRRPDPAPRPAPAAAPGPE